MKKQARLYQARFHIVQALYQMNVAQTPLTRILDDFPGWQKGLAEEMMRLHFEAIMHDVVMRKDALDSLIARYLPADWPLERLDKTLLAVLRAGSSELTLKKDAPLARISREYADVAHSLLDKKSAAMVNAILDKIKKGQEPHDEQE